MPSPHHDYHPRVEPDGREHRTTTTIISVEKCFSPSCCFKSGARLAGSGVGGERDERERGEERGRGDNCCMRSGMPDYTLSPPVRRRRGCAAASLRRHLRPPGGHSRPRLLVLPLFPARSATFRISDTVSLKGLIKKPCLKWVDYIPE